MKATRFLTTVFRLGGMVALVIWLSAVSLAQVALPVSPGAQTQFGRMSWNPTVTGFDGAAWGSFTGSKLMAFGMFGQANDNTSASNPNGHGMNFGFGVFGGTGANGLFGVAGHSTVAGANRNVGMWALGRNTSSPVNNHINGGATGDTATTLAIGLEVGAGGNTANGTTTPSGIAILVDSGDVWLDAGNNTTTVKNLVVNGTFTGPAQNKYTQASDGGVVAASTSTAAPMELVTTGTTTDPGLLITNGGNGSGVKVSDAGTGSAYYANATSTGALLTLQNTGVDKFVVSNNGSLAINTTKFTVDATNGNTMIDGDLDMKNATSAIYSSTDASVHIEDSLLVSGSIGNVGATFVAEKSGKTTIADATTTNLPSLNVTNSKDGVAAGSSTAAKFTASNRSGWTTDLQRDDNGIAMNAPGTVGRDANTALGVTRGADIDTLNISGRLQFSNATTADFTGATIVGMSGNNKFTHAADGGVVAISSSLIAGVEINTAASTNPGLMVNGTSGGSALYADMTLAGGGKILQGLQGGVEKIRIENNGDLKIGSTVGVTDNFTVTAATGNTMVAGDLDARSAIYNSTAVTVNIEDSLSVSGSIGNVGATFTAEKSGKTTIADATTSGAYSLSVTNSLGGGTGGYAGKFQGSNRDNYGTDVLSDGNRITFKIPTGSGVAFATPGQGTVAGGSAALSVLRGAIIDTLDVSGDMRFGNSLNKATVDFTNAIVTGLTDTDAVQFRPSSVQNDNRAALSSIFINKTTIAGTGNLMQLQNQTTDVFVIDNKGHTTITPTTVGDVLTVTAGATGNGIKSTAVGGDGVNATSGSGNGVTSTSTSGDGVNSTSTSGSGVVGSTGSTGATKAGVYAKNTGTNGNAIILDNGGVRMTGSAQAAGVQTGISVAAGTHSATQAIVNALVDATSTIMVSAKCTSNTGTNGDTFVAQVISQTAATGFTVKVTCVEGDLPSTDLVDVTYFIINH